MNRPIKFRVRDMASKEIIGYEEVVDGRWFCSALGVDWEDGTYVGERLKREQWLGLTDPDNRDIYENDVVCRNTRFPFEVKWDKKSGRFAYRGIFAARSARAAYQAPRAEGDWRVVGDIYHNPYRVEAA